ncbi:thiamine phosphate synthase [Desulfurispora thermophila]|uniref:thiamine phosphate synthase n=1 Tax=Desulfurispora thermophila TaxID=265470 RepID=UPI0006879CFE|nr:thiamine phosphate synthase [Desulfurispora thermophila]
MLHRHTCREYFQGIYALTSFEHSQGRSNLEVVREILAAGVKIIQYREKEASKRHKYQECLEIRHLTRRAGALFIVNDDVDIALAVQADGVHVGQDDLPVEVVRRLVGPDMIIGLSTHSPQQARSAVECGADYIGVGPIFATSTKKDVCAPVGLEYLKYVVEHINIPFVAIGGIKEHNIARVVQTGACCIAMVTEIVGAPDIQKKIAALKAAMERARSQ